MADKHQWQHRYIAPIASGMTIADIRPGGTIARCLKEIQDEVEDLKSDANFSWTYPVTLPDGLPINLAKPGMYYARAIREIQDTLDGLSGAVSAALVQSYSEHRQVLGQSAYDYDETPGSGGDWINRVNTPSPGQILHTSQPGTHIAHAITEIQEYVDGITMDPALETAMQSWLETYCVSFVDHENGPLDVAKTAFLYFTLGTWQAAAGIDGAWIPGDLEKGFNALLWTRVSSFPNNGWVTKGENNRKNLATSSFSTWAEFQAFVTSTWAAQAASEINLAPRAYMHARHWIPLNKFYSDAIWRIYSYPRIVLSATPFCSRSIDFYFYAGKPSIGAVREFDDNGDGIIEGYNSIFTVSSTNDSVDETGNKFGDAALNLPGFPSEPGTGENKSKGYSIGDWAYYLHKWSFTTA